MKLTDYHGPVSKCTMCLPAVNIHKQFCQTCFGRGYVALCLNCDGKGKTRVAVSGSIGEMDSTCNLCGGKGTFPASEAAYKLSNPDAPAEAPKEPVELFPEVTNSEKQRLITA
jgi:hypothetical protein